jgi:Amiloride-sensitive sodium channel
MSKFGRVSDFYFYLAGDGVTVLCDEVFEHDCLMSVLYMVADESSETFKLCNCLPSCNSIDYNIEVRYEDFRQQNDSAKEHSSMTIYFADDEFIVLRRYASYELVNFVSHIGGLLGLFLGVSVLTAVEVFYFFVIRLLNNLWWNER